MQNLILKEISVENGSTNMGVKIDVVSYHIVQHRLMQTTTPKLSTITSKETWDKWDREMIEYIEQQKYNINVLELHTAQRRQRNRPPIPEIDASIENLRLYVQMLQRYREETKNFCASFKNEMKK